MIDDMLMNILGDIWIKYSKRFYVFIFTQTEIVSTVLSKESPGVLIDGFRYKAVEPYLLPKVSHFSTSRKYLNTQFRD